MSSQDSSLKDYLVSYFITRSRHHACMRGTRLNGYIGRAVRDGASSARARGDGSHARDLAMQGFTMRSSAAVSGARLAAPAPRAQARRVAPAPARAAAIDAVTFDGAKSAGASLELKTARAEVAKGLVHKYVVMVRQNARRGTASTLTKSEVRGGGKKPFKQKGTGNARAGSSRTPLKPGGGVSFGPKPRDWSIKMNKKERRLAMATALQSAVSAMVVVDDISGNVSQPGTNAFNKSLMAWGVGAEEKAYVITKDAPEAVAKSARNIARVVHTDVTHLNVYDVLNADKIVVEKSALAAIQSFYGPEGQAWE